MGGRRLLVRVAKRYRRRRRANFPPFRERGEKWGGAFCLDLCSKQLISGVKWFRVCKGEEMGGCLLFLLLHAWLVARAAAHQEKPPGEEGSQCIHPRLLLLLRLIRTTHRPFPFGDDDSS